MRAEPLPTLEVCLSGDGEAESCWASSGLKRRGWQGVAEGFAVRVWFVLGVMWVLAGVRAGILRKGDYDARTPTFAQ